MKHVLGNAGMWPGARRYTRETVNGLLVLNGLSDFIMCVPASFIWEILDLYKKEQFGHGQ